VCVGEEQLHVVREVGVENCRQQIVTTNHP
jgi:hypothetical protein